MESETLAAESVRRLCCFASDPPLDQLVEGLEVRRSTDFGLVFRLHRCLDVLEGGNLGLELVVEQPQSLMFADSILTVEIRRLPTMI